MMDCLSMAVLCRNT